MRANKKGFIDVFLVLFLLFLVILILAAIKMNREWIDAGKTQVNNIITDIKQQDYWDYLDKLKLPNMGNPDPQVVQEIRDIMEPRGDDVLGRFQTPETLVLTRIMEKCLNDGKVLPECRRIIDQYTDMVLPNGGEW
jgi:Trk K+ transport system NAD-binding subunit